MLNPRKVVAIVLAAICCITACVGCASKSPTTGSALATPAENQKPAASNTVSTGESVDYGPAVSLSFGTTGAAEDISTKAATYFCDMVKEKSGGNITIELFPNCQLGNSTAQMEMTAAGSIDLFMDGNLMGSNGVTDAQALSPILSSTSKEAFKNTTESGLYAEFEQQFLDLTGVRVIAHNWYRNPTAIISKNKIDSLESAAGVKIRVPNVKTTTMVFEGLGFSATPVAYNESLLSMQQGVIDAIWCTEDAIYSMGFYEVGNYVLEMNLAADALLVYANNARLEGLTEAQRNLIIQCAQEAGVYYSGLADEILAENRAKWEAAGVETITLSDTEMARWVEVLQEIGHKIEDEGTWSKGTYDKVLAAARS